METKLWEILLMIYCISLLLSILLMTVFSLSATFQRKRKTVNRNVINALMYAPLINTVFGLVYFIKLIIITIKSKRVQDEILDFLIFLKNDFFTFFKNDILNTIEKCSIKKQLTTIHNSIQFIFKK